MSIVHALACCFYTSSTQRLNVHDGMPNHLCRFSEPPPVRTVSKTRLKKPLLHSPLCHTPRFVRFRAAFAGQLPCVQTLLSAGAQPHATDASFLDMKTPLHKAADQGHRDVCIALLEAGADPNASDAAGNSALDLLDLSMPPPLESLPRPPGKCGDSRKSSGGLDGGISSGRRGERDAACSVVVLAGGEDRDWDGVSEALERYGGRRLRVNPAAAAAAAHRSASGDGGVDTDTGGGGHDGGGEIVYGLTSSVRRSDDDVSGNTPILGNVDAPQTAIDRPSLMEADGAGCSVGRPVDPTPPRPSSGEENNPNSDGILAAGGGHAASRPAGGFETVVGESTRRVLLEGARSSSVFLDEEGGASAGIPCGECRLPKVVMKRAACCGALLCKPCVRHISARRRGCRRCSGEDGE